MVCAKYSLFVDLDPLGTDHLQAFEPDKPFSWTWGPLRTWLFLQVGVLHGGLAVSQRFSIQGAVDMDMDIDSDMVVSLPWRSFKGV